jgi:hypothetical protein
MREIRPSGSEGGGNGTTRSSLPLSLSLPFGEAAETKLRRLPLHSLALVLGRIGARALILAPMEPGEFRWLILDLRFWIQGENVVNGM